LDHPLSLAARHFVYVHQVLDAVIKLPKSIRHSNVFATMTVRTEGLQTYERLLVLFLIVVPDLMTLDGMPVADTTTDFAFVSRTLVAIKSQQVPCS